MKFSDNGGVTMSRLAGKKKGEITLSVILTVLLAVFVALVFYVNLSCNPEYYDGDIYADISYAKEAWKAKSVFPKDWIFGNQVYVVATPVLAALFYGLTGNGFTAMGIASCVMTVLIILTYDWMMRSLFSYNERTGGFLLLIGALLLKAHLVTSQQGIQIFFTMASYYACYIITAFIVCGCYIRLRQKKYGKGLIAMVMLGIVLSFATGMQSLRQTTVMALPILACEILLIIYDSVKAKKFTVTKSTGFTATVFLSNIAGVIAIKFVDLNQESIYGATTFVREPKMFFTRIFYNMEYIALTFAPDNMNDIPRFIISGTFLLMILVGVILGIRDLIKGRNIDKVTLVLFFVLSCGAVFAAGVLLNIKSRAVYYFMIFPFLSVCVAYIISKSGKFGKIILPAIAIFAAVMISFRAVETVGEVKEGKKDDTVSHQVADYMLENGYENIYSTFGLSGRIEGAESVIVASGDRLHLVQFKRVDRSTAMIPAGYLCIKDDFKNRDNEKSLYLLRDYELESVEEIAKRHGVKMTLKARFGDDINLYAMSENLCEIVNEYYKESKNSAAQKS